MEKLMRQFKHLSDAQYGQILKMAIRYLDGETINESYGDIDNIIYFDRYVRKELDKIINERNRKRGKKK